MTIYERIKELREQQGISQQMLAEKVGFKTASAVNKIELGLRDINQSKILAFANALNTTPGYLLTGNTKDNEQRKLMHRVPLLGTIACGIPILADQNIESYIDTPEPVKADFALRCKGDSMINARIFDGDIVYIRQQETVENGEIAAVLIGTEATLKKVYVYPNRIELRAENPLYKPIEVEGAEMSDVKILGKAVWFLSRVQ